MTREEALEAIKAKMDYYESDKRLRAAIETLVPELKESEGEKIRKALIWHLKAGEDFVSNGVTKAECITYLENQKENIEREYVFRPLAGTDITIAAEQAIRRANEGDHLVLAFNGAYIPVKKGYSVSTIVDIYDAFIEKQKETGIRWLKSDNMKNPDKPYIDKAGMFYTTDGRMCYASEIEKQKEQKPAEWSPTKEQMVALSWAANGMLDNDSPSAGDIKAELRSLHNDLQSKPIKSGEWDNLQLEFRSINEAFEDGKKEVLAHPGKYGLCKPAECKATINGEPIPTENQSVDIPLAKWSEEDEEMIGCIIDDIREAKRNSDKEYFKELCDKEIAWLKSLRPRLSDEEIKKIRSEEYTNGFNDCLLGKQKGWSKGDEELLDSIIKVVCGVGVQPNGLREKQVSFLKSLRPQPKKELSIEKAIQWLDDTFYFLDNSSGRGRDCEITTHDFDSLEEMYDSFRKAVMVDSKHHWKPTKTDVALFNKAVTTNKALTPAERAQLDIIRSKFGCCRAVNCDGIVQEEQCDENEVRLKEIIDLIGYSPISEKLKNEYVSFLKSLSCKSASSKWIPATNPPEKSELVITCSNDNGTPQCIGLSKYVNGKWYDLMGDEDEGYFNVDYWMPIPML